MLTYFHELAILVYSIDTMLYDATILQLCQTVPILSISCHISPSVLTNSMQLFLCMLMICYQCFDHQIKKQFLMKLK